MLNRAVQSYLPVAIGTVVVEYVALGSCEEDIMFGYAVRALEHRVFFQPISYETLCLAASPAQLAADIASRAREDEDLLAWCSPDERQQYADADRYRPHGVDRRCAVLLTAYERVKSAARSCMPIVDWLDSHDREPWQHQHLREPWQNLRLFDAYDVRTLVVVRHKSPYAHLAFQHPLLLAMDFRHTVHNPEGITWGDLVRAINRLRVSKITELDHFAGCVSQRLTGTTLTLECELDPHGDVRDFCRCAEP